MTVTSVCVRRHGQVVAGWLRIVAYPRGEDDPRSFFHHRHRIRPVRNKTLEPHSSQRSSAPYQWSISFEPPDEEANPMHKKNQFPNSLTHTIAVTTALAMAIVFVLTAVPALAQNVVPPTARQAAAEPAFAARLPAPVPGHPATKSRALPL